MLDIEFMFACHTGSLISMEMVWNPTGSHAWSNCIGRLNLKTATELIVKSTHKCVMNYCAREPIPSTNAIYIETNPYIVEFMDM